MKINGCMVTHSDRHPKYKFALLRNWSLLNVAVNKSLAYAWKMFYEVHVRVVKNAYFELCGWDYIIIFV